jgi:hypothetical protein
MKRVKTKWSKGHPIIADQPPNVQHCATAIGDTIRRVDSWWKNPREHGITFKAYGSEAYDEVLKIHMWQEWVEYLEKLYNVEITVYTKQDYYYQFDNTFVRIRHKNFITDDKGKQN